MDHQCGKTLCQHLCYIQLHLDLDYCPLTKYTALSGNQSDYVISLTNISEKYRIGINLHPSIKWYKRTKTYPINAAFLLNKSAQKTGIRGLKRKLDADDQELLEITEINDEICTMPVKRTRYGGKRQRIIPDTEDGTIKTLKYYVAAISMQHKRKFTAIDITENDTNERSTRRTRHHLNASTQADNVTTIPHTTNSTQNINTILTTHPPHTKHIHIPLILGPAQLIPPPKPHNQDTTTITPKRLPTIIEKLITPRPTCNLTDEVAIANAKQQLFHQGHGHFLDTLNETNTTWTQEIYTDGSLENGQGGYAIVFSMTDTYPNNN